ncbi:MAG: ATP synthase F1 subunit delta [Candidatus Omnitrophica bacterium]|nr:ATP synthase F1 subunit delta [Candidatus Omnitrophota bacterium]
MAFDPIAARYAEAVFATATADGLVDEALEQLTAIGNLIQQEAGLRQLLRNPDVDPQEKTAVLQRLLGGGWSALMNAAVQMIISMGRAAYLPEIAEAFGVLVDGARRRLRVVVRAAHPVSEEALARLRATLERRERKTIELQPEIVPGLIGGLQVQLGYRVFDGSIARQLVNLRERLTTIRVN